MPALVHQKCFEHAQREASSRCLNCKRYYCRECVVEHAGRITCTACLRELAARKSSRRISYGAVFAALGFLMAWLVFYGLGRLLLMIPAQFHEGVM